MAATPENSKVHDPLGLQTFALSESAYDLVNRLEGLFNRLIDLETKKIEPNRHQLMVWEEEIDAVLDSYQMLDLNNFDSVKQFIDQHLARWHSLQNSVLEKEKLPIAYVYEF
jgi:hypothetical protein